MKNFLFLIFFLAAAAAQNATRPDKDVAITTYFCRFRASNISESTAEAVRTNSGKPTDGSFIVLFELTPDDSDHSNIYTIWLNSDDESEPNVAEAFYRIRVTDKIVAVHYPDLPGLRNITDDQLDIRCSHGSYVYGDNGTGNTIEFYESYVLKPSGGIATSLKKGFVKRPVTMELQKDLDCFTKTGYINQYNLEEWSRYVASGQQFVHGCSYVATCKNGGLSAVSRCPPTGIFSTSERVQKVGQCCEQSVLKESVEKTGCPKDEIGSAFEKPSVKTKAPWQVRIGNLWEDKSICDGVILEKEWFLTTKACLKNLNVDFLRPDSVRYQPPNFRNVTIVDVKNVDDDKGVDLALVRINDSFVLNDWTTAVQKINLPWNQSLCEKFLENDCHVLMGTEQRQDDDGMPLFSRVASSRPRLRVTTVVGQMVQHEPTPLTYLKRVKTLGKEPVLLGSGVTSWYEKAYFLVGIYVGDAMHKMTNDKITLDGPWRDDGTGGDLISICPYLESIRQKIGS